jgi:MoaA/NifB/PqqE/SkfB family radical SAM enzyme
MFKTYRTADGGEYPRLVAVETTSRCNAECPFCPYNVRAREKTHMDQALFEKIISDCAEFPLPAIEPFLNGEPFVDPKIMDRLEMIRSRLPNTKLRVYSNGYALSPKRVDELVGMGIDHLYISLNTLNPEKYEAIMGFKLERTLENVKYMTDASRRGKIARKITLRMTRMEDTTLEEQKQFEAFCKEVGVRCFIVGLFNYKGDIKSSLPIPTYACEHITRLDILSSGKVALCCMDQEGTYSLGDVNNHSVLEVFRGEASRRYQEMHRNGRRMDIEPCGTCNLFWPSTDNMRFPKAFAHAAKFWAYFATYRPTGKQAPKLEPCAEHAAQIPDVALGSLNRAASGSETGAPPQA